MRARLRLSRLRPASMLLVCAAIVVALAAGAPSSAAPGHFGAPAPAAPGAASEQPAQFVPVRLVTGEVLQVADTGDGTWSVARVAGESGEEAGALIRQVDADGGLHVIPSDLIPLVGSFLDPRLFDISGLIRDGYDLARRPTLPVIVTFTGAEVPVPGVVVDRRLPSIGAVAGTLDGVGARTLRTALRAGAADGTALAGVERIWLDGPMRAALDESAPQIGAPAAWAQGIVGSGVTIAVVDTGVSDEHPDLAGRVVDSEVFAEGAGPGDVFGHGTHVASIAAGSGAASDEQYVGVAYGAAIVSAKVLDDTGFGLESWVIAGMEWAADRADIVNMSINGGPSDGSDPVSQAVDSLSASKDVLFVTSAGNNGPGPGTVETPATADSALAVGAVDKSDQMAWFSAEGPRLDGTLVKPEIVAPGVDITAARAEGADIGEPVGEDYMILSGTSMAAPHVAGAAALLLEAHPDWSWDQLKNALVTSAARLGSSAYVEGGGRVDVAAALDQTVRADVAALDLGFFQYPHDDGETSMAEVTLTNDGTDQVVLDLSVDARNAEGEQAPAGMLTTDTDQLVLAAGASGTVTVTADPATGPSGLLGGALVATTAGEESVHLPLGLEKEVEKVTLTVDLVDRDGGDGLDGFGVVAALDGSSFQDLFIQPGQPPVELRVEPGEYSVILHAGTSTEDSVEVDVLNRPELDIEDDLDLVLDARDATEVTYELDADITDLGIDVTTYRAADGFGMALITSLWGAEEMRVFAEPTDPVTIGDFAYTTAWTSLSSDATYLLTFPEPGQIPEDLTYELDPGDLAEVTTHYSSDAPREYFAGRALGGATGSSATLFPLDAPGTRVYRHTTKDIVSFGIVFVTDDEWFLDFQRPAVSLDPGAQLEETWFSRPVRPAVSVDQYPPTRFDDVLYFGLAGYVDPGGSYGYTDPALDDVSFVLTADGEVVAESGETFLEAEVAPELTSYELVLETERDLPAWWQTSTATRTVWQFDSEHTDGEEPLELLQVDYDVALDPTNRTTSPFMISFRPYDLAERGAPEAADAVNGITEFTAEYSIDDGSTWSDVRELFEQSDGWWVGGIGVPRACGDECFVSLRVSATDDGGAAMEQMITRAFRAAYVRPTATPTSPAPTTTATTTLPGTGAGSAGTLALLGVLTLLLGGLIVAAAAARLRRANVAT